MWLSRLYTLRFFQLAGLESRRKSRISSTSLWIFPYAQRCLVQKLAGKENHRKRKHDFCFVQLFLFLLVIFSFDFYFAWKLRSCVFSSFTVRVFHLFMLVHFFCVGRCTRWKTGEKHTKARKDDRTQDDQERWKTKKKKNCGKNTLLEKIIPFFCCHFWCHFPFPFHFLSFPYLSFKLF